MKSKEYNEMMMLSILSVLQLYMRNHPEETIVAIKRMGLPTNVMIGGAQ